MQSRIKVNSRISVYAVYAVLTFVVLFPLSWAILGAFKGADELFAFPPTIWPRSPTFAAFLEIFDQGAFLGFVWNTVVVAVCTVLLTVCFGAMAGYAFSRWDFQFKDSALVVLLALQLIPTTVNIVPYYMMMNALGLINSKLGLIIIYTANNIPLTIWLMKGFFDTIPRSLDEAASIDGCSKARTFVSVILPLALPGLSVAGYLVFLASWSEFLIPLVITPSRDVGVVSVGLYGYFVADSAAINVQLAATIIGIAPVIIAYVFAQRYLASGLTAFAEK
ncbi:carbohydrate ABC transporter permease [Agrobacterium tumefaciens]|uniref:carbohydrate ABC transporter permease n=1 Tax=Agrobacterium tumefaciens TaxID=358 RepID=UPI0012B88D88|nr:carbohydrate ABC transporter permease [Agrobacterium tumefaciens]